MNKPLILINLDKVTLIDLVELEQDKNIYMYKVYHKLIVKINFMGFTTTYNSKLSIKYLNVEWLNVDIWFLIIYIENKLKKESNRVKRLVKFRPYFFKEFRL